MKTTADLKNAFELLKTEGNGSKKPRIKITGRFKNVSFHATFSFKANAFNLPRPQSTRMRNDKMVQL